MTGHDDFDRLLTDWFEADALAAAPAGALERVVDVTRRRRPRPAWLAGPGSHWVGEEPHAGLGFGVRSLPGFGVRWLTALALLLVIAALVGGAILVGALLTHHPPPGRLGQLAFGLDGDIYLADWDGKHPVKIADGTPVPSSGGPNACLGNWGEGRMWSPDGRYFAYRSASGDRCAGTVVVSDLETGAVSSFLGTGWLITWSPDSSRVATWVDLGKTIGIFGPHGGIQALLAVPSGCALPGDFDPRWSPDGRSLVVWPCEVPIDGQTPHRLPTNDPRSHEQWAYSPDGTHVAYVTAGSLIVAAADGSEDRVLVQAGVTQGGPLPIWSPTGDRIAFDAGPSSSESDEIRIVDVVSGTITSAITRLAGVRGVGPAHLLSFSPEGDRVLFWQADANDVHSLWTVRTDGSDPQLLVTGTDWGDWEALFSSP